MKKNSTLAAILLLALSLSASGCYGKFLLTRKVYEINGKITNDKFVHSIITWVFIYVPVYALAGLADFVILNVIEFWTGKNPLSGMSLEAGKVKVEVTPRGRDSIRITQSVGGHLVRSVDLVRADGQITATVNDADGTLVAKQSFALAGPSAEQAALAAF